MHAQFTQYKVKHLTNEKVELEFSDQREVQMNWYFFEHKNQQLEYFLFGKQVKKTVIILVFTINKHNDMDRQRNWLRMSGFKCMFFGIVDLYLFSISGSQGCS